MYLSEKPRRKYNQKPNVLMSRTKGLCTDIIVSSIRGSMISYFPLSVELTLPISLSFSTFLDFETYQTLTWLFQVLVSYFPQNKILLLCFQVMKGKNVPHYRSNVHPRQLFYEIWWEHWFNSHLAGVTCRAMWKVVCHCWFYSNWILGWRIGSIEIL